MSTTIHTSEPKRSFVHEALFYGSDEQYLAGTTEFIQEGLDLGEPVLVAIPSEKIRLVAPSFAGVPEDRIRFVAMEGLGRNPAWIIPAWTDFAGPHVAAERPARGIGEPIWPGRSTEELVECGRHEALINLAFADSAGFHLLCPYDITGLDADVVAAAHRNHPHLSHAGVSTVSDQYEAGILPWLDAPLSPVPPTARLVPLGAGSPRPVRRAIAELAAPLGMSSERIGDLQIAVSEAVSNSLRHGGGSGEVLLWAEAGHVLCEVRDAGRISDPLAGRVRPGVDECGGRGLWLMTQLCDLVQIRALPHGQVVRLQVAHTSDHVSV